MHLSLIGMSGAGKSYWSSKLSQHGFKRFFCDDLINSLIGEELLYPDGTSMIMGEWMGLPYESRYPSREKIYLNYEKKVLDEALDYIENTDPKEKIVIDTTGSVIYSGQAVLKRLQELTQVVYLPVPKSFREELARRYVSKPLAVLWNGMYSKLEGESNQESLVRSYKEMIEKREVLYESLAEVTIPFDVRRSDMFGTSLFLEHVEKQHNKSLQ